MRALQADADFLAVTEDDVRLLGTNGFKDVARLTLSSPVLGRLVTRFNMTNEMIRSVGIADI